MLLGCIADDITGATDLALTLKRSGLRTIQVMGVPEDAEPLKEFDAVVVALKSRTNPVAEAIDWSLKSADILLEAGARQIFFKYCSTFDSTDEGNIGPVAQALIEKLKADVAFVCPAFPTNKRTIYKGHLFVGDDLLSSSPMKDHPLTPMRDSDLVAVMQRQTNLPVGLIPYDVVDQRTVAIEAAVDAAKQSGQRFLVVDAISDNHLKWIGKAAQDHKLITGGSGVAIGLADNFVAQGLMHKTAANVPMTASPGRAAILSGSCSAATRAQIAVAKAAGIPAMRIDALKIADGNVKPDTFVAFAKAQAAGKPVLIYSSDDPDVIVKVQDELGREQAGEIVENAMAEIARGLGEAGFTKLIVAGGETSGAVVAALAVDAIEIGPEIDPGVPWTKSIDERGLVLALKSGNFGGERFFIDAWDKLSAEA
ncbi:MAG: four-carbon acid sugar kinase family protein [Hyphomicrobiaceae bacterium]